MELNIFGWRINDVNKALYKFGRIILIGILALAAWLLQSHYVATLFENDRNFSMLSQLEKEMTFSSERGFYYSYYKTVTDTQPYLAAITKLMHDKYVEYPDEINAFNRFNIHPEVILGSLYRYLEPSINSSRHCNMVYRGDGLAPVESCTGLGEPIIFYVHAVWFMAGLTVAVLFVSATYLSNSIAGGLLGVGQYFMNLPSCTRVMWSPGHREGWTHAPLLLQMLMLTVHLRRGRAGNHDIYVLLSIFILNCCCLLFWQFSQFIFLTQLLIYFVMEQLRIIDSKTFCVFLHAHFCGLQTAVLLLHNNDMLKSSLYTSFFIVISAYYLFFSSLRIKVENRVDLFAEAGLVVLRIAVVVALSVWLKKTLSQFLGVEDDTHIWELLLSKFTDYKTFHTMLYTCTDVFDFMPLETWNELWETTLLPMTIISILNVVVKCMMQTRDNLDALAKERELSRKKKPEDEDSDSGIDNSNQRKNKESNADKKRKDKRDPKCPPQSEDNLVDFVRCLKIDAGVFYNISQMVVFGVMATLFMRLKLLFAPHMCVVVSLVPNPDSVRMLSLLDLPPRALRFIFYWCVLVPIVLKVYIAYIEQTAYVGEFSDPPLEQLLQWTMSRGGGAVFAGPMTATAAVLLSAGRAVVNHPHYERRQARDRNYAVYKTYGKFTPLELYHELSKLRVTYLIVDSTYCYGKSNVGCTMEAVWDIETPYLSQQPRLCDLLLTSTLDHFYPVYKNRKFSVFKLHDYSVKYAPRSFAT